MGRRIVSYAGPGIVLASLASLLAACGSPTASGVAQIGSIASSTAASGSPAGNSGPAPSPKLQAAQLAYAKCMRGHGVVNFPDPNSGGGYPDGYMKAINANSPQYTDATKACRPLASPAGMAPWSQSQWAAYDVMLLKISTCMRRHGVTNFPDPKGGDKGGFANASGPIDTSSYQYAAAAKACNGPPPPSAITQGGSG